MPGLPAGGRERPNIPGEDYNNPAFPVEYDAAKFYVIKSYSEDDVHKSIKYNVWASTPNGNRKLDAGYKEARAKAPTTSDSKCPVFFFFSVNASGQFCGVAEMVGPVDPDRTLDYWQQDKWTGAFDVKWHIVKDVPNNQFRHILLANNENKPVTNSRDAQEVSFEQGLEVLQIFKEYAAKSSILDDFSFYDGRQRVMQERRARQSARTRQLQTRQMGVRPPVPQSDTRPGPEALAVTPSPSVDQLDGALENLRLGEGVGPAQTEGPPEGAGARGEGTEVPQPLKEGEGAGTLEGDVLPGGAVGAAGSSQDVGDSDLGLHGADDSVGESELAVAGELKRDDTAVSS